MSSNLSKRYACKLQIDRWSYIHVALTLCLYAYFLISAWFYESVLLLVLALSSIALQCATSSMFMNLSYQLDDMHLIMRMGFLSKRMLLSEVIEFLPSIKPQMLRMIYSKFRQKMDIPSPQDQDAFLTDLANRPGFKRDGDRVLRKENQQAP